MTAVRSVQIPASDGYPLAASLHEPDAAPRAALIISSGAAMPQRVFSRFAAFCTGYGLASVTYDYRGIAGSAPPSLAGFPARMRDWALLDLTGVIAWARERFAGLPLLYAGHSFGGHALGLNEHNNAFRCALLVASMSGYWRNFAGLEGARTFFLMNVLAPPVLGLFGYMPGSLGLGQNMSAGVFREWARWCRMKNYFFDDPTLPETRNFATFNGAIRVAAMEDDPWTTPAAVHSLFSRFINADVEMVRYDPAALGIGKVGHFGFFRPQFRETLWQENVDWLVSGLD